MKTIKKVSATTLTENKGKIIDSFNTTDDKKSNAPSLNAVEKLLSYSTDEQIVGKWTDGKPIYRKVISHTITGNTTEHEPHNISNVERAISIRFSLINQYGVFQTSDPTINVNMDTSQISISSEWATGLMYVILEYTKTTD